MHGAWMKRPAPDNGLLEMHGVSQWRAPPQLDGAKRRTGAGLGDFDAIRRMIRGRTVIPVPAGAYTWVRGALINRVVMDSAISDLLFRRDPSLTIARPASAASGFARR